jgi:hypothetical protein
MATIHTRHHNDETGEQHTERVVTVTDAVGRQYKHVFRETEDGHEYQGAGEPPKSAVEAIEELEDS